MSGLPRRTVRTLDEFPAARVRTLVDTAARRRGRYVLYWMTAARRARSNFALERAALWSRALGCPLLVLEALRVDYPHASDRLHRFVLDGMADNRRAFEAAGVRYHPYVEPEKGAGSGLVEALSEDAAVVVGDDSPAFFLPAMIDAAARRLSARFEVVDGTGLLPLSSTDKAPASAYAFRRLLQRLLPPHLEVAPRPRPLADARPLSGASVRRPVLRRWPAAPRALLESKGAGALAPLPLDHGVRPVAIRGGSEAGRARLRVFVRGGLPRYAEERAHPDADATSRLSAYLHFGHVSAHEVFEAAASGDAPVRSRPWSIDRLGARADGKRHGWWGLSESTEAFLDQAVTWRELGFHFARHRRDAFAYAGLPAWARATLAKHARDPRPRILELGALERAETDDEVWNAAQRALRRDGLLHNTLRMLWGKRVLAWTRSPEEAFARVLHLNDRWALDGRDPNSGSGVGWCFGRFDRPFGPERDVFGTVRLMTSKSTRRKVRLARVLADRT